MSELSDADAIQTVLAAKPEVKEMARVVLETLFHRGLITGHRLQELRVLFGIQG